MAAAKGWSWAPPDKLGGHHTCLGDRREQCARLQVLGEASRFFELRSGIDLTPQPAKRLRVVDGGHSALVVEAEAREGLGRIEEELLRTSVLALPEGSQPLGLHEECPAPRVTGPLDRRRNELAVRLVHVPAAFISLVDAERDFYKSACGLDEPSMSRPP